MDEPGRFERSMRESTPGTTPLRSRARSAGPRSRRVLLLTSGLGYGHRRASDAIKQALAELSPASVTSDLDFWSLMNPGVAGSIQQMYLQVVQRHSALYDRVYALDEHTSPASLAYGLLGLAAHGTTCRMAEEWLSTAAASARKRESPLEMALLLLAAAGPKGWTIRSAR